MGLDADFLSMLETTVTLKRNTGHDQWGNETYDVDQSIQCYIMPSDESLGGGDNHEREDGERVVRSDLIIDALDVKVKDKITLPGAIVTYVVGVQTYSDELGADLYQQITVSTSERG